MSAYVQLTNLRWFAEGFETLSWGFSIGEDSYSIPLPCLFVDGPVAICPLGEIDDQAQSVTWRMDRWVVRNTELKRSLPLSLAGMAAAVHAAREFAADPGISWYSDDFEIDAWAATWLERQNTTRGGEA